MFPTKITLMTHWWVSCADCGTPSATPSKVLGWLRKRLSHPQPFYFLEIISSEDFMLLDGKYYNTKQNWTSCN